ncbi:hypothetical protein HN51_062508 [Arachis hypogaea]|nr:alpha-amylase 3, chloroplastic-like [Arachis hypogaea]
MIPLGSVPIKDYAIETPLKKSTSSSEGDNFHEVKIDLTSNSVISAINFILKDEETGAWFQHKGRDFKVPLVSYLKEDANIIGPKKGFSFWPGTSKLLSIVYFFSIFYFILLLLQYMYMLFHLLLFVPLVSVNCHIDDSTMILYRSWF